MEPESFVVPPFLSLCHRLNLSAESKGADSWDSLSKTKLNNCRTKL